jgi:hypothetical protein
MIKYANRFSYEISPVAGSVYAPPGEDEVKAKIQEWPEMTPSDAAMLLILERLEHSLFSDLEDVDAKIESTLLDGDKLRLTLRASIDEVTADRLVAQHADALGFNQVKLPEGTAIHPFNKPGPGTKLH